MNELFGMLIPLLMSGAGIGDILRTLGGAGQSAAGMDGLSAVMTSSMARARQYFPLKQNQETINSAAEMLADRLGMNPYSGIGQGLVHLMGSAYHIAPDMVGSVLGIPNGQQFFSTVANGASGINMAAGHGMTDVLNPYSVMENHKRTMDMAKMVYDLGVNQGGGYNIKFSHGLNMGEMGKVTQRLLSSEMAYKDEDGKRIDPDKDSEKFRENIKKLGSKFNEAASMLSKVTGSVEEALNMMDRLAGGNFLGGTADQASKIASQAKRMATAIRVTSAIAGVSPTEAYANMTNLQQGMANGMGVSSFIANSSGFSSLMGDMAFNATMGYNTWLATNPTASPTQRKQALLAVNGRAQAYASSNGAALAAAVADNAGMFTPEEQRQIENAYRSGRPNDIVELVRGRIGENMYNTYMTDPSVQIAARNRAMRDNPDLMKGLDQAGMEGNLEQAEAYGARKMIRKTMMDLDGDLAERSGRSGFSKERADAVKREFVKMAVEQGMTEKGASSMSVTELRRFLRDRPGIDNVELEKRENMAMVNAATRQIKSMTMDSKEESAAKQRLIQEIERSESWSDEAKADMVKRINDGANLEDIAREFSGGMEIGERKDLVKRVFRGRYSKNEAERMRMRLSQFEKSQKGGYSVDERMTALERDAARQDLSEMGGLKKIMQSDAIVKNDAEAMNAFAERAKELEDAGKIKLKGDRDLSKTYNEAARRMVSGLFGGKLGNMGGDELKEFESRISGEIVKAMEGGSTFQEAFAASMRKLTDDEKKAIGFGTDSSGKPTEGQRAVEGLIGRAERGEIGKFDRRAFLKNASEVIAEMSKGSKYAPAVKELGEMASGDLGKGEGEVLEDFAKRAGELERKGRLSTGGDKGLSKTYVEAAKRMVSGLFGDKLGEMSGSDLGKFETRISGEIVKYMKGGMSFSDAFARATEEGNLTKEEKEAIGYGKDDKGQTLAGQATLEQFRERARSGELKDFDRRAFLSTASSVIDEMSKGSKYAPAVKELGEMASGDLGKGEGEVLEDFAKRAGELERKGRLSTGGDKGLSKTYVEAAKRMVSGLFGDKLGEMSGSDLGKFETRISGEIVKYMKGGMSFSDAFARATEEGNLTKEEKEAIGYGKDDKGQTLAGQATLEQFRERARSGELKDFDRRAFLSTASSVIDERSNSARADAVKEMRRLASGKIGKMSESEAFKRFRDLAKTVGGYDISDEEFDKAGEEELKSVDDKKRGSAKKGMASFLERIKRGGVRDQSFFAMSATGSADKAAILMAATNFKMAGGDLKKLNLGKEWEEVLSSIDDDKAGRTMNAVSNAIHVGGASYQREAIKSAENQALRLGKLASEGKIDLDNAKKAYDASSPEAAEAKKKLIGQLKAAGSSDAEADAAMIATLQEQKIGGVNAMEVMKKGKKGLDAAKAAAKDGYDEQMVGIVRGAARKDSAAYDIGKAIGDFMKMISPFIQDPSSVFKNPIPVKMWGPVDLSGRSFFG